MLVFLRLSPLTESENYSNWRAVPFCRTCGFHEVGIFEKHAKLDGSWLEVATLF
jgi:hypothetical protein